MSAGNRKIVSSLIFLICFTILASAGTSYAAITATVSNLTAEGQVVVIDSSTVIFGINAVADAGEDAVLNSVQVDVHDDESSLVWDPFIGDYKCVDGDPDSIDRSEFASFTVYRDDGSTEGVFDDDDTDITPAALPPFSDPQRPDDCGIRFTAIMGSYFVPVPEDDLGDNAGYDYYVVVKMSATAQVGDDFFMRVAEEQVKIFNRTNSTLIGFPRPGEGPEDSATLTVIETPTATIKVTSLPSPNQGILPLSGPVEVFGINATGPEDSPFALTSVTVRVDDVGELDDDGLWEVTPSDFLVFQVYKDGLSEPNGRNGKFDPLGGEELPDTLVATATLTGLSGYTPFNVTIEIPPSNPDAQFPPDDAESNAGDDFFVVIRTSDTIDSDFDLYGLNQIDDFTLTLEPMAIVATPVLGGDVFYYPPEEGGTPIATPAIQCESLALDTQPLPMDRTDYDSRFIFYPGCADDTPLDRFRYDYLVLGENMRERFLGERDREFTGISKDTFEAVSSAFAQPVVLTVERRHDVLALDVAGGTAANPEYLTSLTLTFSNLGSYFTTLRDFDALFGVDGLIGTSDEIKLLFYSGIAIYTDSNGDGKYTEPALDENFDFDPNSGDQPVEFYVFDASGPFPYSANVDETHYMLQIAFEDPPPPLDLTADQKSDFFIVLRLDSGYSDDSGRTGDGTSVNFGADFKVSLELAEDYDFDGISDAGDLNGDGLVQTPPVTFRYAFPHNGLAILAHSFDPTVYLEARKSEAIINGQDLSIGFYNCGCQFPVNQRVDATSPPTALLAINAATTDVLDFLVDYPSTITEIRLNFSGEGFDPTDIKDVLLARDDKSPFNDGGARLVGVFDIFNDLWNMPPPGQAPGANTNSDEDSPIPLLPWQWMNDGAVDYLVLYPESDLCKVRLYPDDDIEADESLDVFTDNFEMIQSEINPGVQIPRDKVFSGADYFIVIETSDSIAYDDEIKVEIPRGGLYTNNRPTVFEGVDLFDPEEADIHSVRANVPVLLHDLVGPEQVIYRNSSPTAVIGLNMYTNRDDIEVYFEQLVIAFLQYGTRDSLNISSDFKPFENYNEERTALSGIQLYRDANGNGRFDGADIDTLVIMDDTSATLGPNPSRVGLLGDEPNQVLMVFSSDSHRQAVPHSDTGANAGDDFFLVVQTSSTFSRFEDNFSVAIISWGPDTPNAPAPHTIDAKNNSPYDAINGTQWFPWARRSIGFVDSDGVRTRSTKTINTNVFNASWSTRLYAVTDFEGDVEAPVTDPTRQVRLTWTDTNSDNPATTFIDENESGYWIESDIYGEYRPLPVNPLPADNTLFFFDGPAFLAGKTLHFRIMPFRDNVPGNPLNPPFNGPGPVATCTVTFWPSANAQPIAYFSSSASSGCAPLSVCFTDESLQDPTQWSWNFGDGSTASLEQNPCHVFTNSGEYDVCLTATNSYGSNTYCGTITVNDVPVADFTVNSANVCVGQSVQFTDTSTGIPHTYSWDFGDGVGTSSLANPTYSYAAGGTYTVRLTVANDCSFDTVTHVIHVVAGLIADFSYSPIDGCAPVTIQFMDGSTCETVEWEWDFGDGGSSAEQNPQHLYSRSGLYTVCLTARNGIGGESSTCKEVRIYSCIPEITTSVTSLSNACSVGENAPQQVFTVKNGGLQTLTYFITDNVYWLSVSPITGTSTGEEDTITVTYQTDRMAKGTYNGKITINASGAANSPQYVNITLKIGDTDLTQINLIRPWHGESVTSPPTFSWTNDGGTRNAYAVELSLSPGGSWYSTYSNLHMTITANSYTLPLSLWNKVPRGARIYWRVRGANLDKQPLTYITSNEMYSFYKR